VWPRGDGEGDGGGGGGDEMTDSCQDGRSTCHYNFRGPLCPVKSVVLWLSDRSTGFLPHWL
jgi:hypothetical protein